jgi:hypothetical protein
VSGDWKGERTMVVAVKARGRGRRMGSSAEARTNASNGPAELSNARLNGTAAGSDDALAPEMIVGNRSRPQDLLLASIGTRIDAASLLFDSEWYRETYPDVAAASLDPVKHYFDSGFREGRNPNRYFDTNWYVSNNPDVAAAGQNPFLHYLLYGAMEGRQPGP